MKRKLNLLFLLITFLLLTTGCWNRRELNELSITLGIGIDRTMNGQYLVTAQVVNPGEVAAKGASGQSPVIIFQAKGETMLEAFRKMTKESPRRIYPSHLRILVIGESLAREGIGKPLDLISRDWELRSDFYITVAKGRNAEDILKVLTPLEKIPANQLFNALKVSSKAWSATSGVTLYELIENMVSVGKQPVLTGVHMAIEGDEKTSFSKQNVEMTKPSARLFFGELAVFDRDKLVGWLDEKQSRTYNSITNKTKSTVVNITCPEGGKAVLQLVNPNAKMKGKVKNGQPEINIEYRAEYNVGEVECDIDLTKLENISKLEKIEERRIEKMFKQSIKQIQEKHKKDIFGFGEAIHRADPKAWKKLKNNWDNEFQTLPVNIKIDVKIRRVGTVGNSFLEEMK
ncbi:Ger(x)C family spore germination protein [Bacillus sp. CGMCC 1.16607]|uniref:Ger(x)C family spore germination protein n=1 Tax=Bacillus sp. CGMCC 1.16607 TaxID=3351842 RepID=UPI00362819AC